MAGLGKGIPGDMEPGLGREQLIGKLPGLEEIHQMLELSRVFGSDVGSLTYKVLRALDAPYLVIDRLIPEARIDDDRAGSSS